MRAPSHRALASQMRNLVSDRSEDKKYCTRERDSRGRKDLFKASSYILRDFIGLYRCVGA